MIPKYDGTFKVKEKVGVVTCILILLELLKLHLTFHVSYLKPYYEDKEDPDKNKL